jgi:hypothetical protein
MAENNSAIVTLIKSIEMTAKNSAFRLEADQLCNDASAWRDRWNSVMEVGMAGGNCGVPFPDGLPTAPLRKSSKLKTRKRTYVWGKR